MKRLRLSIDLFCVFFLLFCGILEVNPAAAQESDGNELTILIASPAEGETFYTAPQGFRLSLPITGQVVSYDAPLDPAGVDLTITFTDADGSETSVVTTLDDRGAFAVWASMLSPTLPWPSDDPHVEDTCGNCHRSRAALSLPETVQSVTMTAHAADGRTGHATRQLNFDHAQFRELLITVDGLPDDSPPGQIMASTMIYKWRHRTFLGALSGGDGIIRVEGLTHADLTYNVTMTDQIISGANYTTSPQSVIVPAGQEEPIIITLVANAEYGTISGQLVDIQGGDAASMPVLAVNLGTGEASLTQTDAQGMFAFENLPVTEYVLSAQPGDRFHLPQTIDLTQMLNQEIRVHLVTAGTTHVQGAVTLDGFPLPFAQAEISGLPVAHADPITGHFIITGVEEDRSAAVQVAATGCYGMSIVPDQGDLGDINLKLRDDTEVVEHGGSRLYIPARSTVISTNDGYVLQRGVLWVTHTESTNDTPFIIRVGHYTIEGHDADFAAENLVDAIPRLYVSSGEVTVTYSATDTWQVQSGQTLALSDGSSHPTELAQSAGSLLRATAGSVSVFELPPSPSEERTAIALEIAVGTAKALMLMAYAITFIGAPAAVIGVVIFWFRHRTRLPDK